MEKKIPWVGVISELPYIQKPLRQWRSRLGGHVDYFVDNPPPVAEQDYLFQRAVIAYAGSEALGLVTQQNPMQLLEREDDDRGSIAAYVLRLRHLGFSEPQISKWSLDAWEAAKQLTSLHLPCIKELARALVGAASMNGEDVKKVWLEVAIRPQMSALGGILRV